MLKWNLNDTVFLLQLLLAAKESFVLLNVYLKSSLFGSKVTV